MESDGKMRNEFKIVFWKPEKDLEKIVFLISSAALRWTGAHATEFKTLS
jgi:hypothetical protein